MELQDEFEFLLRREREERTLADKSNDLCAKIAHRRFANEYARRARILMRTSEKKKIHLVAKA